MASFGSEASIFRRLISEWENSSFLENPEFALKKLEKFLFWKLERSRFWETLSMNFGWWLWREVRCERRSFVSVFSSISSRSVSFRFKANFINPVWLSFFALGFWVSGFCCLVYFSGFGWLFSIENFRPFDAIHTFLLCNFLIVKGFLDIRRFLTFLIFSYN